MKLSNPLSLLGRSEIELLPLHVLSTVYKTKADVLVRS